MTSNKHGEPAEELDMKAIESIQKALEAIEGGLGEKIDIHGLAASVSLSPFYFHRLFKSAVGYTVEEYIRLRRLAHSVDRLRAGTAVTAAAMESGFESPSHFSRCFQETYGMTPSEFQATKPPLFHVMKPDILLVSKNLGVGELYVSNEMVLQIDVRHQEAMHMVGIELFCPIGIGTPGVDNPGIAWDRFHPVKHTVPGRVAPEQTFGVSYKPAEGGFHYLAAIRVEEPSTAPEGMVSFMLPKGLYACCIYQNESFEAGVNVNLSNAIAYFHKWIDDNGYRTEEMFEAEYYGPMAITEPYQIELWRRVGKDQ